MYSVYVFHIWAQGEGILALELDWILLSFVMKFLPVCQVLRHLGKVLKKIRQSVVFFCTKG